VEQGLYVAGILAAHALLYGKQLAVNLNACFLKLVLQRRMTLADLQVHTRSMMDGWIDTYT
jgi:hypothetical protein